LLDEIGDMPIGTQAKLLRVLEDNRVRRLGGDKEIHVDVRVVAATNKKVEEAVGTGELREDLFYRLNVFHIHLPPLRSPARRHPADRRGADRGHNKKHDCKSSTCTRRRLRKLELHSWPGNVRELRNVLERAVILAGDRDDPAGHLIGLDAADMRSGRGATDPGCGHSASGPR
jgi:transcriptional regulator with PAS, ATPase and Fis domain